eukprot:comp8584_c0_seq1/m.3865 comp8584_c0_seq1/g.3865  ORF comp8584_c0_seq1/g.3865 comp8584_c0_seq1/m.3865 type:complete len:367 (-) comp8584_c0_seq1:264-1364(-)
MIKAPKFDIENSNIALLGSEFEKKVRIAAANHERSWDNAGQKVGLEIWRMEQFNVKPWPKDQYGHFFSGDSYIVLNTYKKDPNNDALVYDVHFWIGTDSTQDEYGAAAYKTVELDDLLGGAPVQHREVQGFESQLFLSYFPTIQILKGGAASGFNHVKPEEYQPRLLHIRTATGTKTVVVEEVEMSNKSLNKGDVFILDKGIHLYQFTPSGASGKEKMKAAQLARALDDERKGLPEVHVFDENETGSDADAFWTALGGRTTIPDKVEDKPATNEKKLFRLSDESGSLVFHPVADVSKSALDTNDVFILDAGYEVFVWVGKGASKEEGAKGMGYATDYLAKNNRPKALPISRIMEGGENEAFNAAWH